MNFSTSRFDASDNDSMPLPTPGEFVLGAWRSAFRFRRSIGVSVAIFLALAVFYLAVTPKEYRAVAEMAIDPRKSEDVVSTNSSSQRIDTPVDSSVVESEGAILQSENVALAVIKKLDLVNSPTFANPSGVVPLIASVIMPVVHLFVQPEPNSDYKGLRETIEGFEKRLTVKREGVTYVFDISFLSPDPEEAAKVANAVADAYVDDLIGAKFAARARVTGWMQGRLRSLSEQATNAEAAVAAFRRDHSIVSTGGRLMDEQQVAELQSQLTLVRANKANAQAKVDRIADVLKTGHLDLSVADALSNQVIISLRDSYADLSKRANDLQTRLGPDHEALRRVRADMGQVKESIFDELKRIGEGYKSDLKITSDQEAGISSDLARAIKQSADTGEAQVQLAQLESDAQAYRALYDTFLQRFGEVVQEQSSPATESRLVTVASPPLKKSAPKTLLVLAGAIVAGGLVGLGVGWIKEKTNRSIRSAEEVEFWAEAPLLASVPRAPRLAADGANLGFSGVTSSLFAESIRELRVFFEIQRIERKVQTVGFTSAISGEGKSTIAVHLAAMIARSKARVIVVDGDMRSRSLTLGLGCGPSGLAEVLAKEATIEEAVVHREDDRFDFLGVTAPRNDASELLCSAEMKQLLSALKSRYDFVFVDLPPVLPIADAKAAATVLDGVIFVTEWGGTSVDILAEAVRTSGRVRERMLGVVLNKVDYKGLSPHKGRYSSSYPEPV